MDTKLITIVDDNVEIVTAITDYLTSKGYRVKGLSNGEALFRFLETKKPDLIILDVMMPGMTGYEICKVLKSKDKYAGIPIIMLSKRDQEKDKVSGLDLGADDYMAKPFSLDELNARIKAVLRRPEPDIPPEKIRVGDILEIDLQKFQVTVDGEKVALTPAEFKILEFLASKKDQVFSRERILEYLWGEEKIVVERTIDVHVRHLREKLGKAGELIKNVRGIGYKLEE